MKKILSFLFIGLLAFILVGCKIGEVESYSIQINDADSNITLKVDETKLVTPTYEGAGVVWTVNNDVVSVTDGLITALKEGTAIITVAVSDHLETKVTITVTVTKAEPTVIDVTSVVIGGKKETAEIGDKFNLTATVLPTDATDKTVTWSSSNTAVATVNNGQVEALTAGTTVITATAGGKSDSFTLTVNEEEEYFDPEIYWSTTNQLLYVGETETLEYEIDSMDGDQSVTWTFDQEGLVSIDENNVLTALAAGVVTITLTSVAHPELTYEYKLRIALPFAVDGAKDATLVPGKEIQLSTRIEGNDKTLTFTYSSSNPSAVTVDANGLVKAVDMGEAVITITASDALHSSLSFNVTVVASFVKIGDETIQITKDQVLTLENKTYTDNIVIYANDFTIKGNGTVIAGHVTIQDGLSNVKFVGIKFTDGGYIDTPKGTDTAPALFDAEGLKGFTFENCAFYKISSANDASLQFFLPCEDFVFESCTGTFDSYRGIRFEAPIHNLTVNNCVFENTSANHYDTLRAMDLIDGEVTITNNVFDFSVQSLIQFRYIGTGNYNVLNNQFKNAACVSLDMREAKTATFEGKAVINVKFNTFDDGENDWGTIRLRNSWASGAITNAAEKVEVNINYNKFINIVFDADTTYYVDKPTANCTAGTFNIDKNYSDLGEPQEAWFSNMQSSYEGWFTTEEEIDAALFTAKINDDDSILVVGTMDGVTKTPYATLALALAAAKEGDTILLLPGAHTGDAQISINNLTIASLNGDYIPGANVTRYDEATYTGKLSLAKGLKGLTIKGIKFTGASSIVNVAGDAGTAQATATNLDGFNFINNLVECDAITGNGFIAFVEGSSSYSHDINISNNKFYATTATTTPKAIIWLDNNYNLVACDNTFENVKAEKAAFYVNDQTKGLSGEFSTINNNSFKNITGSALWINWLSPLPLNTDTCVVSLQNNSFDSVSEYGIYLGKMNNADKYAEIKVMFNSFKDVKNCLHFVRVTKDSHVTAKYNKFLTVPTGLYAKNDSANQETSGAASLDLTDCLFLNEGALVTPAADKFAGDVTYTTTITSEDDLPGFDSKATAIKIKEVVLFVGDEYQMEITYTPKNTTNKGVDFVSSDPTVATVDSKGNVKVLKAGTVTITATYKLNAEVKDSITLTITGFKEVELYAEGNGFLKVGDELDIAAAIVGSDTTGEIVWSSSDNTIATVVNGKVTALKAGKVTITATIKDTELATNLVLEVNDLSEMDELIKLIVGGHRSVVEYQTINYIGYESGYEKVPHQVYTSVNDYYFAPLMNITQNRNSHVLENTSGAMQSIEFVVVHDTGSASPGADAKANSNWALNLTNTTTSYHYVVGNDGIFQQLDENIIAWHAGDGASAGATTTFYDTGVTADPDLRKRPTVTISQDGYYVVNGTKTTIAIPSGYDASTPLNDLGLATIVKDGKYFIPTTYYNTTYKAICAKGGGTNGVGIESAVNTGSDVYLTWQRLAKLVADILIRNNLTPDRVFFHNNFSNKQCPNTMIHSDNIDMFLDMCYMEYYIRKNYSDYTITFKSNNPDIIDDSGRVIGVGPYKATNVSYTVTITKGEETKTITLNSLVQGSHKH